MNKPNILTRRQLLAQASVRTLNPQAHHSHGYRQPSRLLQWRGVLLVYGASTIAWLTIGWSSPQETPPPVPPGSFPAQQPSEPEQAPVPAAPAAAPASQSATTPAITQTPAPQQAAAAKPSPADLLSPPMVIEVSPHGTISLSAQNVAVDSLLELLAVRSKQNIVASDKVEGVVSVNLYDVPFNEALEAILSVNGLISSRQGEFIFVYTQTEFDAAEKAKRQMGTQVFTLQFLNAADAESFVKPILSKDGQVASKGTVVAGFTPSLENGGADDYAFTTRLVVTDYAPNLKEITRVLKEIDIAPQQVRVEATVISANVEENNAYGLDIAAIGHLNFANLVGDVIPPLDIPNALQTGKNEAGAPMANYPTTGGGGAIKNQVSLANAPDPNMKLGIISNDVAVFLTVLDDVTDLTVLARPAVTCLNRQRAAVLIGERVAYLSTTQNQTSTTQTVEYLDTGVKLTFRPFITDDGMIRMELLPSLSSYKLRDIGTPGGGSTQVPDESSQELRTNVRVRSGQTIVLGGLFNDKMETKRRQIPFLSEIPLLGGAMTGQADQVRRQEIIFLVTPTVIEDDKLYEEGKDSLEVAENVRVGARAGLLPFSREQVTANYQRDAFNAYTNGDLTKTLYYSNAALRMKPVSPAMQQLRERVIAMPGSDYQDRVDQTLIERRSFAPTNTSATSPAFTPAPQVEPTPAPTP